MQKLRQIRIKLALTFKVFILFVLVFFASLTVYTYTRSIDATKTYAATSSTLNFQGRLLNSSGSVVPDGVYNLEFKLYDGGTQGGPAGTGESNAGTLLWTETRDFPGTDDRVRIVNGYFSVNLGSVTAFPAINWDQELWLTMNVGGSGTTPSWDGEMLAPSSKRTKLTGVPYAFVAGQLRKTVGANTTIFDFLNPTSNRTINLPDASGTVLLDSTGFANGGNIFAGGTATLGTNDANDLILETGGVEGLRIDQDGDVGIGTLADAVEALEVNGGIKLGNTTNANAGTIRWTGTDFEGYNGTQWVSLTLGVSSTSANFVSSVANLPGTATATATGLLSFTSGTAVSSTAGSNTFVAPANGSFRSCMVVTNANWTAGTATLRWRVNGVSQGTGVCAINATNIRTSSSVIAPGVVSFNAGDTITVVIDSAAFTPANTEFTVYWSVDYGTSGANGTFFAQGGNTFGTTAVLGTTDNQGLSFITNNATALTINSSGTAEFLLGLQSNSLDRSSTGDLLIGGTNAASLSLCNGANCDTVNIGTNADSDAINIGDSLDAVTISGGSASSIVWNGITISASELGFLDTKDAILLDQNDLITTDGVGAISSGSGLEIGTGGLGLLQGCANNEGLIWNEAGSTWGCSLPTLDSAYANDPDKILAVNNAAGLTMNLTTTGGLFIQDAGVTFASFTDTGGITFQPAGTSAITFSLDDNSAFIQNGTVTNTGFLQDINLTFGADGLTGDTVSALNIDVTSANDIAGDIVYGLNIGNLTGNGANTSERGLRIGSGWSVSNGDADVVFDDTTPVITLGATDNTGILSITDSAATPNTLIRIQDHATNFGASVEAGAFIDYNSMYVDEFFKDRAQVVADGNQVWGDNTEWNTDETGTCTWDGTADSINGTTAMVAGVAGSFCSIRHADLGVATPNTWIDADFLPTIVMKIRPSVAGAGVPDVNHQFFAGIADGGAGAVPATGAPTNGIYFTNASDAAGVTGTANWFATTDNGGTATSTPCSVAVSETAYALLMIKVMSTTLVKFYIDADVSNGIQLTECGTGNTANINLAGMTPYLKADWDAAANASTLGIDFYRVWQDDAPVSAQPTEGGIATEEPTIDLSDPLQSSTDSPIDVKAILSELTVSSEELTLPSERLDVGVLIASKAVVSPVVTANELYVNVIKSARDEDIKLEVGDDNFVSITDSQQQTVVGIDSLGNATFNGTLTASSIKLLGDQGLDFGSEIANLQAQINSLKIQLNTQALSTLDLDNLSLGDVLISGVSSFSEDAIFAKLVTIQKDLNVLGVTSVQGLTVNLDLIAKGALTVDGKATFKEVVRFQKDVEFEANVSVKGDLKLAGESSGRVYIKEGQMKVKVEFAKPKESVPVLAVTISNGKFAQYSYQNLTKESFEIVLPANATEDIEFTWITIQSDKQEVQP